jgi:hypothetical protein
METTAGMKESVPASKLRSACDGDKPWLKSFGKLRSLRTETVRINAIIEKEFERTEPEDRS